MGEGRSGEEHKQADRLMHGKNRHISGQPGIQICNPDRAILGRGTEREGGWGREIGRERGGRVEKETEGEGGR